MVFVVGALMAVYVLIRGSKDPGADTFRSLWAIGLLTLGLAVAADFVPQVAGPFAILVGVAMAVRNSGEIGQVLGSSGRVGSFKPALPSAVTVTQGQGGPPRRR